MEPIEPPVEPHPEDNSSDSGSSRGRRRRGRGLRRHIGRQRKQPRKIKEGEKDSHEESGETSAVLTDTDSSTVVDVVHRGCQKSINEPHLCSESEGFFETTASEWTVYETDMEEATRKKRKKRKKKTLAYKRKYTRGRAADDSESDDEDEMETASSSYDSDDLSVSVSDNEASSGEAVNVSSASPSPEKGKQPTRSMSANVGPALTLSTETDDSFMKWLVNNMKLLMPLDWTIDVCNETLRLILINQKENASVDRCITFNKKENKVGAFIHGVPLHPSNKVFKPNSDFDPNNAGSVTDFLSVLVSRLVNSTVCSGIKSLQEFWSFDKGYIDYSESFESPQFRSPSCVLVISGVKNETCFECRGLLRKLNREQRRSEKEKVDPCSARDKDLSRAGLLIKKNKYKKMAKQEKKRADRLQSKVESLKIQLTEALKDELTALLRSNQQNMSDVQKTFWLAQMKAMDLDDKRGMRWDPMLIRIALHLHSLSPNAYEFLGESKILTLPSRRRLFDYSHFIEAKEGCQKELLLMIKKKAAECGPEEHYTYINLMFDEMHVKSGLVISRSTGELVGYTKLSGIDEELSKMQKELSMKTYRPRLAKKVLVYLAQGITSEVQDVVAIFTTDDLSAYQLYDKTWTVISHLEEVGMRVLALTFDGASVNRKFVMMHESLDEESPYTYSTKNLASEDHRPLYLIVDPPHLLKTIRNALSNSFCHRKSRSLWKNGEHLSWRVIELAYDITKNFKNPGHKMNKAHIKLTSFSVMTVIYATQTLSNSTAKCIEYLSTHPRMKKFDTKELVGFLRLMNRFFDCVNTRTELSEDDVLNVDKEPYTNPNDVRLAFLEIDVLKYFDEWKKDVSDRPGVYTDAERSRMIISHQALGALHISIKSIVSCIRYMLQAGAPFVSSRVFNQDPVEQCFGKLRRKQGDGNNPRVDQVLNDRLNLVAQGHVASSSKKGNVQGEKRKELTMDSRPLPSRKVVRKSKD